jgi:hypothetical protein
MKRYLILKLPKIIEIDLLRVYKTVQAAWFSKQGILLNRIIKKLIKKIFLCQRRSSSDFESRFVDPGISKHFLEDKSLSHAYPNHDHRMNQAPSVNHF